MQLKDIVTIMRNVSAVSYKVIIVRKKLQLWEIVVQYNAADELNKVAIVRFNI